MLTPYYIDAADSSNSRTVTAANLKGRKAVLERVRKQNKRLTHLQPEAAFRESYRIVGETVVTKADYTSGRVFRIGGIGFIRSMFTKASGSKAGPSQTGYSSYHPVGAPLSRRTAAILSLPGDCISSDRFAKGGLRVQASCMAMGQAAGAPLRWPWQKTTPLKVPLKDIREMLDKHGAIVPAT